MRGHWPAVGPAPLRSDLPAQTAPAAEAERAGAGGWLVSAWRRRPVRPGQEHPGRGRPALRRLHPRGLPRPVGEIHRPPSSAATPPPAATPCRHSQMASRSLTPPATSNTGRQHRHRLRHPSSTSPGPRESDLWVPETWPAYATCAYSWITPPSRSRLMTLISPVSGSCSGRSGAAWARDLCGR